MLQHIIVGCALAACVIYALHRLWHIFARKKDHDNCHGCDGCPGCDS